MACLSPDDGLRECVCGYEVRLPPGLRWWAEYVRSRRLAGRCDSRPCCWVSAAPCHA